MKPKLTKPGKTKCEINFNAFTSKLMLLTALLYEFYS